MPSCSARLRCSVRRLGLSLGTLLGAMLALVAGRAVADSPPPLHERVDALLESLGAGPPAPLAEDGEFLRRLHLALIGEIPTAAEAREFLDDASPDKRERWIDRLLDDPRHVRRLVEALDTMWMERRPDKHVKRDEWLAYLRRNVEANRPYHEWVAEMLAADGQAPEQRAAAKFYLEREAEPNLVTRDLGRMFFGVDLQCAQCHDHPLIDDYFQADYYGLQAFVGRSYLFTDAAKKISYLGEKAEGDFKYKSVFTEDEGNAAPRLPQGIAVTDEPRFEEGQEYQVKPDKNAAGVPSYSRRQRFAQLVGDGTNPAFRRNIANRLWALVMGTGLVQPVDLHHQANPASSPEVLELVANEFAAMNFDMRALLRELARTRAFQRSYHLPDNWSSLPERLAANGAEWERLAGERTATVEQAAATTEAAAAKLTAARETATAALAAAQAPREALAAATAALQAAESALQQAQAGLATEDALVAAIDGALAKAREAAKSLAEESSLATAMQQLEARLKVYQERREQLAADATAKQAAREQATVAMQGAQQAAAPLVAAADAAESAKLAVETEHRAARDVELAARREVKVVRERLEELAALRSAQELDANSTAAEGRQRERAAELAAATAALRGAEESLAPLRAKLEEVTTGLQAATTSLESLTSRQTALTNAVRLIAEARTPLDEARGTLTDDKPLAEAAAELARRGESLGTELAKVDASLPGVQQTVESLAAEMRRMTTAVETADVERAQLAKRRAELDDELLKITRELDETRQQLDDAVRQIEERWSRRFNLAGVVGLSPEQLAWSVLQATGVSAAQRAAAVAELDKKSPLSAEDQQQPEKVAARRREVETLAQTKLAPNVSTFVGLFGAGAGQPDEFFSTADQALFFANGPQVRSWVAASNGLAGRLIATEDPAALADELYLSVLTRRPTADEIEEVRGYLADRAADRTAAIGELIWGLLTSSEFRFAH